jgi:ABC-2 type transport system permease protein
VSPRLFVQVLSIQARKLMSYRANFWIAAVVAFVVELALAWFLWSAVFRETGRAEIAGFTLSAMVYYYVAAILLGKLVKGPEREMDVSQEIYDGSLTRYLLYPTNYVAFKYAQQLGHTLPAVVELAIFGVAALVVLPAPDGLDVSAQSVLMAAVSVAVSNLLHFLLVFPIEGVAFWADNVWSLNVMYRFVSQMLGGLMLPLTMFPAWAQPALDLLPFKYLYFFPATTLLGHVGPAEWARGIAVSLLWCAVAALAGRLVWLRGTRQYTGVGI